MMKKILSVILFLSACGSSIKYDVYAPGIQDATMSIESAVSGKVYRTMHVNLQDDHTFSALELGVGADPIRLRIKDATYVDGNGKENHFGEDEELSAMYVKDTTKFIIDINPLTTIAACLMEHRLKDQNLTIENISASSSEVDALLSKQFEIESLQGVAINDEVETDLSNALKYKLLTRGFTRMATNLLVPISEIATLACVDISNDGILDGNSLATYDDQTFKARLAGGAYQEFLNEDVKINSADVFHFVDLVSKNHDSEIFSASTGDFPFEIVPPEKPDWNPEQPIGTLPANFKIDFTVIDNESNPTFSTVEIQNSASGEIHFVKNDSNIPNRFTTTIQSSDFEKGDATLTVIAQDLFGNVRKTPYPIEFE